MDNDGARKLDLDTEEESDAVDLVRNVLEAVEVADGIQHLNAAWRVIAMEMIKTDPKLFLSVCRKLNLDGKQQIGRMLTTNDFNKPPWTDLKLREEMALNRKIQAIKRYRELTGSGLSESKKAVEAFMEIMPSPLFGPPQFGPVFGSGGSK